MISKFLVGGAFFGIDEGITSFLLLIDSKIFWAFSQMYSLFIDLAQAQIFRNDLFDTVINNIYAIFGVVALFILAFNILQGIINPEEVLKGDSTIKHVIIRLLLAVFLTCMVPTIFNFLYDFQYSLLSYQVIPKALFSDTAKEKVTVYYQDEKGHFIVKPNCTYSSEDLDNVALDSPELEKMLTECGVKNTVEVDASEKILKARGNEIGYYVLSGFLYPAVGLSDVETSASKYFTFERGLVSGILSCGAAALGTGIAALVTVATVPTTGGTLTGPALALTTHTGVAAAVACGITGVGAFTANGVAGLIDAEHFKWSDAINSMIREGDFGIITAFAPRVTSGEMQYTPIVSTVAGIILLYLVFSFCLDLGIRAAKLIMYQILAPIAFLMSVMPKNKDLLGKWFKNVLSIWFEVFTRVFCLCAVALLISKLDFELLNSFSLIARAILVLGLVAFAKQVPKLLGEITGIDTGNMQLGIKDKLAAGGAFAAGALIGGGVTALARNGVASVRNIKNNWKGATNGERAKMIFGGLGSTLAGGISGAARGGKAGWGAKSTSDMKGAASKGAAGAVNARDKRSAYKASHGNFGIESYDDKGKTRYRITGVAAGHVSDAISSVGEWAEIGTGDSTLGYYATAAQATNAFNDMSESTYKKKQEYIDQSSVVKSLEAQVISDNARIAELDALRTNRTITAEQLTELNGLRSTIDNTTQKRDQAQNVLKQMQVSMSIKKKDVIALAATKLGVDQRTNYANNAEFQKAYNVAIQKAFGLIDENENATGITLTADNQRIFDALSSGQAINDEWIKEENIAILQDAIDKANTARQHLKSVKEREHAVQTGNRSQDKKDS